MNSLSKCFVSDCEYLFSIVNDQIVYVNGFSAM